MPTIVREHIDGEGNAAGFQVMEYDAIVPVLAEAIKLQQTVITDMEADFDNKITTLEAENRQLENRLARLEALLSGDKAAALDASAANASGIELRQNRPNPTDETTAIQYTLPKDMTDANLVVFDLNGRTINSQPINDQNGIVELSTRNWAAGTYIYAVVVDGRPLARKKMLVK